MLFLERVLNFIKCNKKVLKVTSEFFYGKIYNIFYYIRERSERNEKLTDQEIARRDKMKKIQDMGLDAFGQRFERDAYAKDLQEKYKDVENDAFESMDDTATVVGRIMFIRKMGKASFFSLKDKTGKIQVYVSINDIGEDAYNLFKSADLGDIVGVYGKIMKTQTGELTIKCLKYTHLVKALRPLPEKFHGLQDVEDRYRKRYLDLITNDESMKVAMMRPKIIRTIQKFLDDQGFVEVETPILTTLLTGASARPFITHHNTQDLDMYLRIALELNLKRLLVGGMERVYEIGRTFRNEGMDPQHNPEFTLMEVYQAYSDLEGMMDLTENMYKTIARDVCGKTTFHYLGHDVDLDGKWPRVSMTDAIKEKTGIDFKAITSLDECIC